MSSIWDETFSRWYRHNRFDQSGTLLIFGFRSRFADRHSYQRFRPARKHRNEKGRPKGDSDEPSQSGPVTPRHPQTRPPAFILDNDKEKSIAIDLWMISFVSNSQTRRLPHRLCSVVRSLEKTEYTKRSEKVKERKNVILKMKMNAVYKNAQDGRNVMSKGKKRAEACVKRKNCQWLVKK